MELIINNQTKTFIEKSISLDHLLVSEKLDNVKGIAVAINNQVIPRKLWSTTFLQNKDSILIITATQGG